VFEMLRLIAALSVRSAVDGTVELAVIDQGRGIRRSLEEKMQFNLTRTALYAAIVQV